MPVVRDWNEVDPAALRAGDLLGEALPTGSGISTDVIDGSNSRSEEAVTAALPPLYQRTVPVVRGGVLANILLKHDVEGEVLDKVIKFSLDLPDDEFKTSVEAFVVANVPEQISNDPALNFDVASQGGERYPSYSLTWMSALLPKYLEHYDNILSKTSLAKFYARLTTTSFELPAVSVFWPKINGDYINKLACDTITLKAVISIFKTNKNVLYNKMIKILASTCARLRFYEAFTSNSYMLNCFTHAHAVSITIDKMQQAMSILKPVLTAKTLAEICIAPTTMGKIGALVSLLEAHNVYWQTDLEGIDTLVQNLLSLLQKTLGIFGDGFHLLKEWVFPKEEEEEEVEEFSDALEELVEQGYSYQVVENTPKGPRVVERNVDYDLEVFKQMQNWTKASNSREPRFKQLVKARLARLKDLQQELDETSSAARAATNALGETFVKTRLGDVTHLPRVDEQPELVSDEQVNEAINTQMAESWLTTFMAWIKEIMSKFPTLGDIWAKICKIPEFFRHTPLAIVFTSICSTFMWLFSPLIRNFGYNNKKAVTVLDKMAGTFDDIIKMDKASNAIIRTYTTMTDAFKSLFGVQSHPELEAFKDTLAEARQQLQDVYEEAHTYPDRFVNDQNRMQEIHSVFEKNKQMMDSLRSFVSTPTHMAGLAPLWSQYNNAYSDLKDYYLNHLVVGKIKQVPTVLWLWGDSHIGKSSMMMTIVAELSKLHGRELKVWTRCHGVEFANGYTGQDIIFFDDFESLNSETCMDAADLMNYVSVAPTNMNMAHLADKNRYFMSKYIIVFSNHATTKFNSVITTRIAFEQRRDLLIHASLPGHSAAHKSSGCNCFPPKKIENGVEWYQFHKHKFISQFPIVSASQTHEAIRTAFAEKEQVVFGESDREVDFERRTSTWEKMSSKGTMPGDLMSLEAIIKRLYEIQQQKEKDYKMNLACLSSVAKTYEMQPQSTNPKIWDSENKPILLFIGPPGTGKTTVMNRIISNYDVFKNFKTYRQGMIDQYANFDSFWKENKQLYIPDLSHLPNVEIGKLLMAMGVLYDYANPEYQVMLCANNEKLLAACACENIDSEQFKRRCLIFDFSFRKLAGPGIWGLFGRFACSTDLQYLLRQNHPEEIHRGKSYHDFVKICCTQLDLEEQENANFSREHMENFTDMTLATWVGQNWRPRLQQSLLDLNPRTVTSYEAQNIFKIDLPIQKFIWHVSCIKASPVVAYYNVVKHISHEKGPLGVLASINLVKDITSKIKTQGVAFYSWQDWFYTGAFENVLVPLYENKVLIKFQDEWIGFIKANTNVGERVVAAMVQHSVELEDELVAKKEALELVNANDTQSLFVHNIPEDIKTFLDASLFVIKSILAGFTINEGVKNLQYAAAYYNTVVKSQERVSNDMENMVKENLRATKLISAYNSDSNKRETFAKDVKDATHQDQIISIEQPKWESPTYDVDYSPKEYPQLLRGKRGSRGKTHGKNARSFRVQGVTATANGSLVARHENELVLIDEAIRDHADLPNPEGCMDQALPGVMWTVAKNHVRTYDSKGVRHGYALMLKGKTGVTFGHGQYGEEFYIEDNDQQKHRVQWIKKCDNLDLALFKVDSKTCRAFRDITNHLPTSSSPLRLDKTPAILLTSPIIDNKVTLILRPFSTVANRTLSTPGFNQYGISYSGELTSYTTTNTTQPGDCGSLLFLADPTAPKKLVGMHTHGSSTAGFAQPLRVEFFQEFITEGVAEYVPRITTLTKMAITPHDQNAQWEGHKVYAFPLIKTFTPSTSHIQPTILQQYIDWELDTAPAILDKTDPRNVNQVNVVEQEAKKWLVGPHAIDQSWDHYMDMAVDILGEYLAQKVHKTQPRVKVLTKEEAINRCTMYDASHAINMKSSAGFPYSNFGTKAGKLSYLKKYNGENQRWKIDYESIEGKTLNHNVDYLIRTSREDTNEIGLDERVVFNIFPKDEALKLEKIENANTRTICGAPLDYDIAMRMYFHAAISALVNLHNEIPIKIGINPYSLETNTLMLQMLAVSDKGCDFDFKGWDFTVPKQIISRIWKIYDKIYMQCDPHYKPIDGQIRKKLMMQLIDPCILVGGKILRATTGMMSGQPGTAMDNSLANLIMLVAIYLRIMEENEQYNLLSMPAFQNLMCVAIFGDDLMMAIHPSIQKLINGPILQRYYKEFGMQATPADKSAVMPKFRNVVDLEFLSRSFSKQYGVWVAPLKKRSIRKCAFWHHGKTARTRKYFMEHQYQITSPTSIKEIMQQLLPEALLHGEEFFNEAREGFYKFFYDIGEDVHVPTYSEYVRIVAPWRQ